MIHPQILFTTYSSTHKVTEPEPCSVSDNLFTERGGRHRAMSSTCKILMMNYVRLILQATYVHTIYYLIQLEILQIIYIFFSHLPFPTVLSKVAVFIIIAVPDTAKRIDLALQTLLPQRIARHLKASSGVLGLLSYTGIPTRHVQSDTGS